MLLKRLKKQALLYSSNRKIKRTTCRINSCGKQAIKQGERRLSYQELTSLRADLSRLKNDQTISHSLLGQNYKNTLKQ